MLLLIVDDEHHAADSLESMLAPLAMREGFQMIKAYSGKEALNLTQDKVSN